MDDISNRRNELANDLTETMSEIESQSGIFLIKPMFSYKSLLVYCHMMNKSQHTIANILDIHLQINSLIRGIK